MKKILLAFFTLAMSATVMANDIVVLDSMYHRTPLGDLDEIFYYAYDQDGRMLVERRVDKEGNTSSYDKYIYNEEGINVCVETWVKEDFSDNFYKYAYTESRNFVDGVPTEVYTYFYEPDMGEYVGDVYVKNVKSEKGVPTESIIYNYDPDLGWVEGVHITTVLNADGKPHTSTLVTDMGEEGKYIVTETYEYDSHGYQSKYTMDTEIPAYGIKITQIAYSDNEYGIYDAPIKITHYLKESEYAELRCTYIEEMYYGNLTGIRNIMTPSAKSSAMYDLSGRKIADKFRGIMIQNGRKTAVK